MNTLKKLKLYFLLRAYTKNALLFGEMLSYAYMGEPIGFKEIKAKNLKYALKLVDLNIQPWSYEEMSQVGWGKELPALKELSITKKEWLVQNLADELINKEIQKIDLANKI